MWTIKVLLLRSLKRTFLCLTTLLFIISSTTTVAAEENNTNFDCSKDEYASFCAGNDLFFYGSSTLEGNQCRSDVNIDASGKDYKGRDILSSAQLSTIKQYQSVYSEAGDEFGVPWEMIAVIHLRETGLAMSNPSNGQGIYQFYNKNGGPYPEGKVDDKEFLRQTKLAANFIKSKSQNPDKLSASDSDEIKDTFFGYNGRAEVYKQQAKSLGYGDKGYEGSPYVMNIADEVRDPESNQTSWGQIKTDGGSISYPANRDYGAFVVYGSLAGISSVACGGSQQLATGGMNLNEAQKFMATYKNSKDSINYIGGAGRGCSGGPLANCVSFSVYFINKYTNLKGFSSGAPGHGKSVASNISDRNSGVKTGKEPRPYAVFSTGKSGGVYGHTGVVLGVDTARGKIIIGEASCSRGMDFINAYEYNLEDYRSNYVYAYIDSHLKEGVK